MICAICLSMFSFICISIFVFIVFVGTHTSQTWKEWFWFRKTIVRVITSHYLVGTVISTWYKHACSWYFCVHVCDSEAASKITSYETDAHDHWWHKYFPGNNFRVHFSRLQIRKFIMIHRSKLDNQFISNIYQGISICNWFIKEIHDWHLLVTVAQF